MARYCIVGLTGGSDCYKRPASVPSLLMPRRSAPCAQPRFVTMGQPFAMALAIASGRLATPSHGGQVELDHTLTDPKLGAELP